MPGTSGSGSAGVGGGGVVGKGGVARERAPALAVRSAIRRATTGLTSAY